MKLILFTLRRTLLSPIFWLLLICTAVLPVLFAGAGRVVAPQPAGYACEGTADQDAARVIKALEDSGFIRCDSEEQLFNDVAAGRLDAGVTVPADLGAKLSAGAVSQVMGFIKSPTTLLADLWQEHAGAALFTVYAPYITASAFEGTVVTKDEVFDEYYRLLDGGYLFRFEISTEKGVLIPDKDRSERFFTGALSILLYITAFFGLAQPLMSASYRMGERIPLPRARRSILLPGLLLRLLLLTGATALACRAADMSALFPTAVLCLLSFTGLHLLALVLPGQHWQPIAVMLLSAAGIALCPIYTDLSLFLPIAEKIRLFVPPYWIWLFSGNPRLGYAGAGAAALLILLLCIVPGTFIFYSKMFKKTSTLKA